MKMHSLVFSLLLMSLKSISQTETDSLFYYDLRMNSVAEKDAKWISRKTELKDTVFLIKTSRKDTSRYLRSGTLDKYNILSDKKMLIERSFFEKERSLPGTYQIDVTIVNHHLGLYELDLYSKELHIHKKVYSNVLISICPVLKTVRYHPNCAIAHLDFHQQKGDSIWNSEGEPINDLYFDENVDELPTIEGYEKDPFKFALTKHIQNVIDYSGEARDAEIEGRVYVSFIITSSGKIEHLRIMRGIHPMIDNSSLDALRKIKIAQPAMKNGHPVDMKLIYPFSYHIQ